MKKKQMKRRSNVRAGSNFTSVQQYFSQEAKLNVSRSTFDRTHKVMLTMDSGYIVPFLVDEILPGDTFNVKVNTFARLLTQTVPFMDNLYAALFFFFVPYRIVWDNWKAFFGERDPIDYNNDNYLIPSLDLDGSIIPISLGIGSIWDYMGLPAPIVIGTDLNPVYSISALPFRAHVLTYNYWFRDQNLIDEWLVPTDDGPDAIDIYLQPGLNGVMRRRKRYDYFTSALPWPQKGDAVPIPGLGGTVTTIAGFNANNGLQIIRPTNAGPATTWYKAGTQTLAANGDPTIASGDLNDTAGDHITMDPRGSLVVPSQQVMLDTNSVGTINALRTAYQTQKFFERDARGGTRYVEMLDSHFGVKLMDLSYRPEYLGGGITRLNMTPVPQTSETSGTAQANLAAYSTFAHHSNGFMKSFSEHGVLLGYINVYQDYTYQNNIEKMWMRRTRYDLYWREFANLSEQPILNLEIFQSFTLADLNIFGWQERYAEYKYKPSKILGKFRSTASGTLDSWHLAQKFTSAPSLNQTFIEENPPVDRVVAVTSEPQFYVDMSVAMKCTRPMPVRAIPGMSDHF